MRNISLYSKWFRLANRTARPGYASDEWCAPDDTFNLALKLSLPHVTLGCDRTYVDGPVPSDERSIKSD